MEEVIQNFKNELENRYGQNIFWEEVVSSGGRNVVLMTEKLAQELRKRLKGQSGGPVEVSSFEKEDTIGAFYRVKTGETVNLLNHPGKEELVRVGLPKLIGIGINIKQNREKSEVRNEIMAGETVRIYGTKNGGFVVTVYHDFENLAPKAIGWVDNISQFNKIPSKEVLRPEKLIALEESVKPLLGLPYFSGGKSFKTGFDCSSFVQNVTWQTKGVWLPRRSDWQFLVGEKIENNIQSGDLIFFRDLTLNKVTHVGVVSKTEKGLATHMFNAAGCKMKIFETAVKDFEPIIRDEYEIAGYRRIDPFFSVDSAQIKISTPKGV